MRITTITRKEIDVFDPRPEDICLVDIAWALSQMPRFAGHTETPMTVLEHMLEVAARLRAKGMGVYVVRWGLLHDAAEAYISDVPKPIKDRIPAFIEVENKILDVVWRKYMPETGLVRPAVEALVHEEDMRNLAEQLERRWGPEWTVSQKELVSGWLTEVLEGLNPVDIRWEVEQRPGLFK